MVGVMDCRADEIHKGAFKRSTQNILQLQELGGMMKLIVSVEPFMRMPAYWCA